MEPGRCVDRTPGVDQCSVGSYGWVGYQSRPVPAVANDSRVEGGSPPHRGSRVLFARDWHLLRDESHRFGSAMLLLVILFWAVVAVEMFHPLLAGVPPSECERCGDSFKSVWDAAITLFQQTHS